MKRLLPGTVALLVFAVAGGILHPGFLSGRVGLDLLSDQAVLGLAALGEACVLVSGGLDLSVGSLAALASVVLARLVGDGGCAPWAAALAVLALGAGLGGLQGALVVALDLPPFLVTLAGMFLFRGLALALAAQSVAIRDPAFASLAASGIPLGEGHALRPAGALLVLALVAVAAFARSRFSFRLQAIGGDERAARLLGVPVGRTKLAVHAVCGASAALAGIALALSTSAGNSTACAGLELDAIAAAVVGGVALGPGAGVFTGRGRGGAAGAMLGVLVFGVLADLVLFQGSLSAGWTRVAMALLLLLFLGLDRAIGRRGAPA